MTSTGTEDVDFSKLKVPDLKKELKARGLSTSGNKIELVERLQGAIKTSKLDDAATTTESVDDLDEDLLNDDLDEHLDSSVIQELDSVIEATSPSVKGEKRKLESSEIKASAPKKIVLNRNPSVSSDTQNGSAATDTAGESKNTESNEKKIVKLSELSVKERLEMRAKKFGVELSATARKAARSERFGANNGTSTMTGNDSVGSNVDVLKKRAERFGAKVSPVLSSLDYQQRLEKRKERFGLANGANVSQSEKAKQRLERFKQPVT